MQQFLDLFLNQQETNITGARRICWRL